MPVNAASRNATIAFCSFTIKMRTAAMNPIPTI